MGVLMKFWMLGAMVAWLVAAYSNWRIYRTAPPELNYTVRQWAAIVWPSKTLAANSWPSRKLEDGSLGPEIAKHIRRQRWTSRIFIAMALIPIALVLLLAAVGMFVDDFGSITPN